MQVNPCLVSPRPKPSRVHWRKPTLFSTRQGSVTCTGVSLKGQCHEIFDFWFFSWISFPQAPEYTIRTVSIFVKNSRRYSRLKVHHRCRWHRWQMEKIFNQKNLGSRVNIYINFCLQVHFKESAAWYCFHILPQVSLTPAANLPPISLTPVANLPPVSTTLAKLMAKFPPVSLIPVVHEYLWGWEETDPWKKPGAKNLVTLSLQRIVDRDLLYLTHLSKYAAE